MPSFYHVPNSHLSLNDSYLMLRMNRMSSELATLSSDIDKITKNQKDI